MLRHRGVGANDDVALLERGAQRRQLVLGELVLVREGLELLFLDETALCGLLDEALGRREVVQVNRVAQLNPFRFRCGAGLGIPASGESGCAAGTARRPIPVLTYRTPSRESPFPNIAFLRFSYIGVCNRPCSR